MPLARYAVGKASWETFVVGRTKLCRAEPAAASRPDVELLVQLADACGSRDLDQEAPKRLKVLKNQQITMTHHRRQQVTLEAGHTELAGAGMV